MQLSTSTNNLSWFIACIQACFCVCFKIEWVSSEFVEREDTREVFGLIERFEETLAKIIEDLNVRKMKTIREFATN